MNKELLTAAKTAADLLAPPECEKVEHSSAPLLWDIGTKLRAEAKAEIKSAQLLAYKNAFEAFKLDAICNCDAENSDCNSCNHLHRNDAVFCASLRLAITKLEKEPKEEDK